ncbi:MAG: DUF6973 domain-containing protein [Pseudonocardiaceae bacterium]
MGWSDQELAAKAGVSPWQLRDDLADGNPAEIIGLAQQFHAASGQAGDATGIAAKADEITAAGYRVDDTPVHDVETHVQQIRTQLGNSGENMELIARDLATIAEELADRTTTANSEIDELERLLNGVRTAVAQLGLQAYVSDAGEMKGFAIGFILTANERIKKLVDEYEDILSSRLKALSDMGYDPPAELDVDNRQPIQRIFDTYQVSTDPDGMVTYPDGAEGWLAKKFGFTPKTVTATEARLLDDIGWAGVIDANDIQEGASTRAQSAFGGAGIVDGHADAFRHAYWNALLTRRFDEDWTSDFTTAHERKPDNRPHEEAMDLHNNEVGRRIARENPHAGPDELAPIVEQAVRDGETVVIDRNGDLGYSDRVPIGETGRAPEITQPPGTDPRKPDDTRWSGGYHPGSGVDDDYTTSGDY